jgi:hypothetical protein
MAASWSSARAASATGVLSNSVDPSDGGSVSHEASPEHRPGERVNVLALATIWAAMPLGRSKPPESRPKRFHAYVAWWGPQSSYRGRSGHTGAAAPAWNGGVRQMNDLGRSVWFWFGRAEAGEEAL